MAVESTSGGCYFTLPAGADLSASQYKFVKLNGSGQVVICAATTDIPVGVLQNKPKSGQGANVCLAGITKVVTAAATVTASQVGTDASGNAAIYVNGTDTTKYPVGQCLIATGAASGIATISVDCLAPHRGA